MVSQLGNLYDTYCTTNIHYETSPPRYDCNNSAMHPLKWFISRQLSTLFWYIGEIFGDWYPLLRTQAVVKNKKVIWIVYATCGIFNISKISLIILHLSHLPTKLYTSEGAYDNNSSVLFYSRYYMNQFIIIITSVIYDISVYLVLKKTIFKNNNYEFGFLKNFKNLSEYRILISSFFSVIFLPIISVVMIIKFYTLYGKKYMALDFDFEKTRIMITSIQYYMIFIDQILLVTYREQTNNSNSNTTSNLFNSSNGYLSKSSTSTVKYQFNENPDSLKFNDNIEKSYSNMNNNKYSNYPMSNNNNSNSNSQYFFNMLYSDKDKQLLQKNSYKSNFNTNKYNLEWN